MNDAQQQKILEAVQLISTGGIKAILRVLNELPEEEIDRVIFNGLEEISLGTKRILGRIQTLQNGNQ